MDRRARRSHTCSHCALVQTFLFHHVIHLQRESSFKRCGLNILEVIPLALRKSSKLLPRCLFLVFRFRSGSDCNLNRSQVRRLTGSWFWHDRLKHSSDHARPLHEIDTFPATNRFRVSKPSIIPSRTVRQPRQKLRSRGPLTRLNVSSENHFRFQASMIPSRTVKQTFSTRESDWTRRSKATMA